MQAHTLVAVLAHNTVPTGDDYSGEKAITWMESGLPGKHRPTEGEKTERA